MDYHKDKFISPIIMNELNGLEIKKNRVDHSSTSHDDQIFSMLMALYVWYYGKDIMANFGIRTYNIRTDEDYQESMLDNENETSYIEIMTDNTENSEQVDEQLKLLNEGSGKLYEQFLLEQDEKDRQMIQQLMSSKLFKEAYAKKYNINLNTIDQAGVTQIPDSVFDLSYDYSPSENISDLNKQFNSMTDIR